jgi:hypothetical protein
MQIERKTMAAKCVAINNRNYTIVSYADELERSLNSALAEIVGAIKDVILTPLPSEYDPYAGLVATILYYPETTHGE